ncbi:MAG: DNA recombination protein RmuC [Actinobacteria bacterium]|nr:DNA recombination protein RmuC [Actinomycetota bacterium]
MVVIALFLGLLVGAVAAWLVARAQAGGDIAALRVELAHERGRTAEKVAMLEQAERDFSDRFDALAADALRKNTESFLELASGRLGQKEQAVAQLVQPLREALAAVQKEVGELERSRRQDYGALRTSVQTLAQTSDQVRAETARLATALRSSEVRGAWGQMQLRNAVETAGMLAHCDFDEEVHTVADGRAYRPDLVVRLPGGRRIVVDAKAPLKALLDSVDAPEEQRAALVADYARHVREHVKQLSSKSYWDQLEGSPDYVVMFLPGEGFFRTAVEADPSLLGSGGSDRVILASPMMLIALLRTVAAVWNEEKVAESAREVNRLGQELYERLTTMTEHIVTLGKRLDGAVQAYNQSVGSLERRVLPKARELTEHGVRPKKELPELEGVDRAAQPPQTVELAVAKPAAEPAALPPAADAA